MISCKSFDKSTECFKASNLLYNDTLHSTVIYRQDIGMKAMYDQAMESIISCLKCV